MDIKAGSECDFKGQFSKVDTQTFFLSKKNPNRVEQILNRQKTFAFLGVKKERKIAFWVKYYEYVEICH